MHDYKFKLVRNSKYGQVMGSKYGLFHTWTTPRQDTGLEPQPSTSRLSRSSLGLVSPYDISPMPNTMRKTSNRGRKASVAAIITSSPYKNDLIEKSKQKEENVNKLTKAKNKKQNEKKTKGKLEFSFRLIDSFSSVPYLGYLFHY